MLTTSNINYGQIQVEEINQTNIALVVALVEKELFKRQMLYYRYKRKMRNSDIISINDDLIKIPFEKYIADMTIGYFAGKTPRYIINKDINKDKQSVIERTLQQHFNTPNELEEMEVYIDKITAFNDDSTEFYNLVKDYVIKSACYEYLYENKDNEIIYTNLDALWTCAVWDFGLPKKVNAIVRIWWDIIMGIQYVEVIDKNGKTIYQYDSRQKGKEKQYTINQEMTDKANENFPTDNWNGLQIIAIENPEGTAIFEGVISLIEAYERVIGNIKNTFQYNDQAKLVIENYQAQHQLTITKEVTNKDGTTDLQEVSNPDRELEDKLVLERGVFYLGENGKVYWVEKDVKDSALMNYMKTLVDIITMMSTVPNITDLGFTNADNASALDRKFFSLEQSMAQADKLFKKGLKERWEKIFDHINRKSLDIKKYDHNSITISFYRNLPTDKKTETDRALSLQGLLSDETIISMLPDELDPQVELDKMNDESDDNMLENIARVKEMGGTDNQITTKEREGNEIIKDKLRVDENDDQSTNPVEQV